MKSKIKFDLDENNNPVIVAEIIDSDDLRDKVASRFKEGFGYDSNWANVKLIPNTMPPGTKDYQGNISPGYKIIITPVSNVHTLQEAVNSRALETLLDE